MSLCFSIIWFWSRSTWVYLDTIQVITVMWKNTQPFPAGAGVKCHYPHSCGGSQWATEESHGVWGQMMVPDSAVFCYSCADFSEPNHVAFLLTSLSYVKWDHNGRLELQRRLLFRWRSTMVMPGEHLCRLSTPAFRFQVTAYHKIYSKLWFTPIFFSKSSKVSLL